MDLNVFDKSPEMKGILVQLYEANKLYSQSKKSKGPARIELSKAIAELFHLELSAREKELVADVLISLSRQAEKEMRRALSEKLSKIDTVPLSLILHLANDEISIAAPILKNSRVLNDLDLLYIVKSKGADYWQVIASRANLRVEVVDALASTRDIGTAIVLTANERIHMTGYALQILSEMAQETEMLAGSLLKRPEMPASLAFVLYDHVGTALKDYINAFFEKPDIQVDMAVDDILVDFVNSEPLPEFMPDDDMIKRAKEQKRLQFLTTDMMMTAIKDGDIKNFIAMFSVHTDISIQKTHNFLMQACPKGFVIACRAFGIQKNDFSRIFLLTHKMRSKDRMVDHKILIDLLEYFDTVRPEKALRIVSRTNGEPVI
jgi:hypothetical protein